MENQPDITMITREQWDALPPKAIQLLPEPAKHVVLSMTESPPCSSTEECVRAVQRLQRDHMFKGLPDIAYNFIIGGDGYVYEGRGWHAKGRRHPKFAEFDGKYIEISHIGEEGTHPAKELNDLVDNLIAYGSEIGSLKQNTILHVTLNICNEIM